MALKPEAADCAETIVVLAEEIARAAPDCAEKALQIIQLVRTQDLAPDRNAVQDAIESTLVDDEMSDSQLQTTTSAVVRAMRSA